MAEAFQRHASSSGRADRVRYEDAGSAHRSAVGATEDEAARRTARSDSSGLHRGTSSRRLLALLPPVLAIAYAWSLHESPGAGAGILLAAGVGVAPLAAKRWPLRLVLAAIGLGIVASVGFRAWPGDLARGLERGLRGFETVALPFDAGAHPEMHGLILLGAYGFTVALTLGVLAGHPLAAGAVAAVGIGWPATVVPGEGSLAMGALALAATLWPGLVMRARGPLGAAPTVAAVGALVLAAVVAAGAGVRPGSAALDWRTWSLLGEPATAAGVKLVWDASYTGISFPARRTTVFRIRAPRTARYWRASTLDTFTGDRWVETLRPRATGILVGEGDAAARLPVGPLRPPGSERARLWVAQRVEVAALVDDRLVAGGEPMQLASGDLDRIVYYESGVMRSSERIVRGDTYTVWSSSASPAPRELVRSPPSYPPEAAPYLDLGRAVAPAFGAPGRERTIEALFDDLRYSALWSYEPVWKRALAVAGTSASPYEATLALERWLRSQGGFVYDEQPPLPAGLPPLVDFLERTKRGYCQQFAGSMALMLRLLGIPSRVAVGFTSGTWKDGVWTVTDHEAHAWVEVWFAGHGWLPFDPTPGRGRLSGTYTSASDSADAVRALGTGQFLDFSGEQLSGDAPRRSPTEPAASAPAPWPYLLPLGAAGLALVLLVGGKRTLRRRPYRRAGPREQAAAARGELAAFLRDQRVPIRSDAGISELRRELLRLGARPDAFAAAFAEARYGPPGGTASAARRTRGELRAVLGQLRASLGLRRRLLGLLSIRSLRA